MICSTRAFLIAKKASQEIGFFLKGNRAIDKRTVATPMRQLQGQVEMTLLPAILQGLRGRITSMYPREVKHQHAWINLASE